MKWLVALCSAVVVHALPEPVQWAAVAVAWASAAVLYVLVEHPRLGKKEKKI